jgi:polyisoprenoid-binding protein YceI
MATVNWVADPSHSEIGFKVKHLMISNVKGNFGEYHLDCTTEDNDFNKANVSFVVKTASVNTGNEQRDGHLRSADFFDSEKYPDMTFKATGTSDVDHDGSYNLKGDLTIKDATHPIELGVEFGGVVVDPWGNTKAGFTISGKIDRKKWGLVWNGVTEAGGLLVGEEVRLHIDLELLKVV